MIIGHQKQWNFLIQSAKHNRLAHAYLFVGPSQIGKKRVALEFAKFLNCQQRSENYPCNQCQICYQIEKKIWPNLSFIEADENDSISIEKVRELKERLSLASFQTFFKVAIIDNAHKLTQEAQSALLKQLEEPKGNCIIILISEYPYKILPTILSRTQIIQFFPPKEEKFLDSFKNYQNQRDFIKEKIGLLIEQNNNKNLFEKIEKRIEEIKNLKKASLQEKFRYAKEIARDEKIQNLFEIWLAYFRELMYKELIGENQEKIWTKNQLQNILTKLQELYYLISTSNINQELALEIFLLDL